MTKNELHPDNRFIHALLENDARGIEEIYRQFRGVAIKLVTKNSGSLEDARDVFQEALITITHQGRDGLQLTCAFHSYLYLVCRGKWFHMLKKRKREAVTIRETDRYMYSEDAQTLAEKANETETLYKSLEENVEKLSPSCKQILKLSWEGIPLKKVAGMLTKSYGYIRKKKSECMKKLIELSKNLLM